MRCQFYYRTKKKKIQGGESRKQFANYLTKRNETAILNDVHIEVIE